MDPEACDTTGNKFWPALVPF